MKDESLSAAAEAASQILNEDMGIFDAASREDEQTGEAVVESTDQHETVTEVVRDEEIPDDIKEWLETPDFEAEAEEEVESYLVQAAREEDEEFNIEEEWDPEKKELLKKLRAAEKKAQFFEEKRVESERGKWSEEAAKYFPYAAVDAIKATSRRAFLREAKAQHEARKTEVEQVEEKVRPKLEAELRDRIRKEVEAEFRAAGKESAAQAWGSPTVSVTTAQQGINDDERFNQTLQKRGLAAAIRQTMNVNK
jgi:hypothetical protein